MTDNVSLPDDSFQAHHNSLHRSNEDQTSTGPEILLPTHLESHLAARPNLEDESLVHPGHILRYVGLLARQAQPRSSHPANVSFSVFKIAASHANAQHGTRSTAFVPPFRGRDHALDTQVSGRGQ